MAIPHGEYHKQWFGSYQAALLCRQSGSGNIILDSVGWAAAADARPKSVKVLLRQVKEGVQTTPIEALNGTPQNPIGYPRLPGSYTATIKGARITQNCSDLPHEGKLSGFTELIFVVEVGSRGADITRAWIDYTADGHSYRLPLSWEMGACGTAIDARNTDDGAGCRKQRTGS